MTPQSQQTRELRAQIGEILVNNNLRTDQLAISQIVELLAALRQQWVKEVRGEIEKKRMYGDFAGAGIMSILGITPEELTNDSKVYDTALNDILALSSLTEPKGGEVKQTPKPKQEATTAELPREKVIDQIDFVYKHPEMYEGREKSYVREIIYEELARQREIAIQKLDDIYDYGIGREQMLEAFTTALQPTKQQEEK